MNSLWFWDPDYRPPMVLPSLLAQERDDIHREAASILADLQAKADTITAGITVVIPENTARRKEPDLRLSANIRSSVVYRRRAGRVWGLK